MENEREQVGVSAGAQRLGKGFSSFTRCLRRVFHCVYGLLADRGHGVMLVLTRSRGGPGHGTLRLTRRSKQAGKALRSQGHHYARVM